MEFTYSYLRKKDEKLAENDEDYKDSGPFRLSTFIDPLGHEFDSIESMSAAVRKTLAQADEFYSLVSDESSFHEDDKGIWFKSAIEDGSTNERVRVDIFRRGDTKEQAVIIIPHWNASEGAYSTIGKILAFAGFAAYVMTLPHHGTRGISGPPKIANDFLNADLGAAIRSVRQSVCDTRSLISWLHRNGAKEVSVVGVSLGSCIASLTTAFDNRVSKTCLLLTAGDFAETVWRGRATRHIRAELESNIDLPQLRQIWALLNPSNFLELFQKNHSRLLIVSGKIDTVVPYDVANRFVDELRATGTNPDRLVLPCGHYTLSFFPFSWLSLIRVVRFLRKTP